MANLKYGTNLNCYGKQDLWYVNHAYCDRLCDKDEQRKCYELTMKNLEGEKPQPDYQFMELQKGKRPLRREYGTQEKMG